MNVLLSAILPSNISYSIGLPPLCGIITAKVVVREICKRCVEIFAQEIGLGNRTNTILQSAFFRITGVIPVEKAVEEMKHFIVKSYGKKGEDVVNKNYAAVDRGGEQPFFSHSALKEASVFSSLEPLV